MVSPTLAEHEGCDHYHNDREQDKYRFKDRKDADVARTLSYTITSVRFVGLDHVQLVLEVHLCGALAA